MWWYLIFLIPIAMIVVTVMMIKKRGDATTVTSTTSNKQTTETTKQKTNPLNVFFGFLTVTVLLAAISYVLFLIGICALSTYRWYKTPSVVIQQPEATTAQEQLSPTTPSRPTEKKLYSFSEVDGCVKVEMHPGHFGFFPQGGEVFITPPKPLNSWHSKPGRHTGKENDWSKLAPGMYTVCKLDPRATGIEIEN
jgi:preprotein translocase subunit SecG